MTVSTENGQARLTGLLRTAVWGGAGLLMLAPIVATLITEEMAWSPFDFVFWAGMLLTACGAFEGTMRLSDNWAYRAGAVVAIGAAFLLVWVNGAVGIIGSENNSANLLYAGVLGIGVLGAAFAGFRPRGMALTLAAMAAAQVAIAVAALVAGWGSEEENWLPVITVANGFFAAAWTLSAGLFRRAGPARGVEGGPRSSTYPASPTAVCSRATRSVRPGSWPARDRGGKGAGAPVNREAEV